MQSGNYPNKRIRPATNGHKLAGSFSHTDVNTMNTPLTAGTRFSIFVHVYQVSGRSLPGDRCQFSLQMARFDF